MARDEECHELVFDILITESLSRHVIFGSKHDIEDVFPARGIGIFTAVGEDPVAGLFKNFRVSFEDRVSHRCVELRKQSARWGESKILLESINEWVEFLRVE